MTPDETIEQQARREAEEPTLTVDEALRAMTPFTSNDIAEHYRARLTAAAAKLRSKPQPSVEEIMAVVEPFIEEGISQMHDHSSDHGFQYDSDHPNWERTMNDLRQRMIDAKLCQP